MINPQKNPMRYEVTQYDGREVTNRSLTATELAAIDPGQYDHYLSTCFGLFEYQPETGPRVRHPNKWPKLGPVCLAILQNLQWNAGAYLTPREMAELTGYKSLARNGVLSARVHALRQAHGLPADRFIETRSSGGYALRWPKERTWLWVERIAGSAAESGSE